MRKFLITADGKEYELCPLTWEEFTKLELWDRANDTAFDAWLRANNLHELNSFNDETIAEAVILLRGGHKDYVFNPSADGETWVPYSTIDTITAQYTKLGSKCRGIASRYLDIWRPGGIAGLFGADSKHARG